MPSDPNPANSPRVIEADDIVGLAIEMREQSSNRAWPSIRQLQAACRSRFELGIGTDRARIMLNRALLVTIPEDDNGRDALAERSKRIHSLSLMHARDYRARAREALVVQQGGATQRLDDVRQLLNEAISLGARRGVKPDEVVADLTARFQAAERQREAVLRGQPEAPSSPEPDAAPAITLKAAPDTAPANAPDATPAAFTIYNDPQQVDLKTLIAKPAITTPDAAPDAPLLPAPAAAPDANGQLMTLLQT